MLLRTAPGTSEEQKLPKLYAIIDRATVDARGLSVAAFAQELCEAGVTLLQYRDKDGGPQKVLRAAAEIFVVFEGIDATLIMNDRADLALLADFDGVHVGQGDLPVDAARVVVAGELPQGLKPATPKSGSDAKAEALAYLEAKHPQRQEVPQPQIQKQVQGIVGVSTHNDEQVRIANASSVDYIAIGPVFTTSSKANAEPVVGLEGVRRARALTTKPLVAIGGITLANARSVVDVGADSVALIGGLFVAGRSVGDVARDFLDILR